MLSICLGMSEASKSPVMSFSFFRENIVGGVREARRADLNSRTRAEKAKVIEYHGIRVLLVVPPLVVLKQNPE